METNLEITYYYIINSDLKMSKGKIAAQVSHVAMDLGYTYGQLGKAVVLGGTKLEMDKILSDTKLIYPVFAIHDAGLTEVPEGSLTCIGFRECSNSKEFTDRLKLV